MKTVKKIIASAIVFGLLGISVLTGCKGDKTEDNRPDETVPETSASQTTTTVITTGKEKVSYITVPDNGTVVNENHTSDTEKIKNKVTGKKTEKSKTKANTEKTKITKTTKPKTTYDPAKSDDTTDEVWSPRY